MTLGFVVHSFLYKVDYTHASLYPQLIASNNVLERREFILEYARKVGVEGAAEFLENPNNGIKEVCSILQLSHPSSYPINK